MKDTWAGQEEFRELGKDKALEKYKNRIDIKVKGFMANLGRRCHINHMKEELIEFYKLLEEDVKELEKNEKE
jgi:hypothetical protein